MNKEKVIELEYQLIEQLTGKFNLLQPMSEKEALADEVLMDILKNDQTGNFKAIKEALVNPDARLQFVRHFCPMILFRSSL